MIDWWIIPALMTLLTALMAWRMVRARDLFEAALAVSCTIVSTGLTVIVWILCFVLKVIA